MPQQYAMVWQHLYDSNNLIVLFEQFNNVV